MRTTSLMMGFTAAIAMFVAVGCGGPITYAIKGTPKTPEVDGKIVAGPDKDEVMTTLKINLEHLAPPGRLGSGGTFVVWAKIEKRGWQRVAALKYDDGNRKGTLEGASVPVTSFDLQITVEKEAAPEGGPSGDVVLAQHVN
jgi:hypothetical protein